ncbi:MAG: DUF4070 domain-containing protein, partial [Smithella sp.]
DNPHSGDNVDTVLNFVPVMPAEKLVEGYRRVIAQTYAPKNYFARASTLISRLPDLKITKLSGAEPWKKKLAKSKLTNYPRKTKMMLELARLFFSPFGIHALWFIIRSSRFGLLALPAAIELVFRGRHYVNVAGRIAHAKPQPLPAASEDKRQAVPRLLQPLPGMGK